MEEIKNAIRILHIEVIRLRRDIERLHDEVALLRSRTTDDPELLKRMVGG